MVYADSSTWRRSPYHHNVTGSGAASKDTTPHVGAYWRINTSGLTSATLSFNTGASPTNAPVIAYRYDGGTWTRAAVASSVTLSIPADTSVTHLLEWCFCASDAASDRWTNTPPTNAIVFTGLTANSGATFTQPAARAKLVVVKGDSIKEGRAVTGSNVAGGGISISDITLSAYFRLQDALNAEVCLDVFSGQGIISTGGSSASNVPNLLNSYNLLYAGVTETFSPQPDLLIIDEGQNDSGQTSATVAAALVTIASGVGAKKTLIMGDESGYQTAACQSAVTTLGANAAYGTPASVGAGASVSNTAGADTYDGIHPTATAHQLKLFPAVAAPAYALLYGLGGTTVVGRRRIN